MTDFCAVTSDLNRYLAAEDRAEAYNEAVALHAASIMLPGQDYYPFSRDNFIEAMGEIDFSKIDSLFHTDCDEEAHKFLSFEVTSYWSARAELAAQIYIDNQCHKCFGNGCRDCEEPPLDYFNE